MSGQAPFDWLCDELAARTSLSRIEARGSVRLTLKRAGFTPDGISASSLSVVVRKLLVRRLEKLRVEDALAICEGIAADMPMSADARNKRAQDDTATTVFGRLGRLRR